MPIPSGAQSELVTADDLAASFAEVPDPIRAASAAARADALVRIEYGNPVLEAAWAGLHVVAISVATRIYSNPTSVRSWATGSESESYFDADGGSLITADERRIIALLPGVRGAVAPTGAFTIRPGVRA